jgi:hypothetical protein
VIILFWIIDCSCLSASLKNIGALMKYIFCVTCLLITQGAFSQINYKEKLTADYFECKVDSECTLVSGWCSYFAINKTKLSSFNKISNNEKNPKNACPPGWAPMEMPKPACIKKQCSTADGKLGL